MIFERRKKTPASKPELKPVELPIDYLKMVEETLNESLKLGLDEIRKIHPISVIKAGGAIYSDEVLLAVTLSHGETHLNATTVYASADFNPQLPEPHLETILNECLDSAGSILSHYLDPNAPERMSQLASSTLSSLDDAPFEWTPMDDTKVSIFVKIDKSNPTLDQLTEEWLKKNDPHYQDSIENDAEAFFQERLDAIEKAKTGSGSSGGDSGPIRH